jgi:diguanylate cyclase (GGDEF)-like protein
MALLNRRMLDSFHALDVEFFRFDVAKNMLLFESNIFRVDLLREGIERPDAYAMDETSIPGWVSQHRALVNVPDTALDPRCTNADPRIRSGIWAPVERDHQLLGVLGVTSHQTQAFAQPDENQLILFADQVGAALGNARRLESVEREAAQLATLREIDRTLNSMLDLSPMLETMLSRLEQIMEFDCAAVLLLEGHRLRAVAARGLYQRAMGKFVLDVSTNSIFQGMANTHKAVAIDDVDQSADWIRAPGMESVRSWLGAPLVARDQMIGQIEAFSEKTHAFTPEHCDLLMSFANHAAIAIANVLLHRDLLEQARTDSLTQVLNHRTYIEELHAAQARGERLAMIMLDLDNFKRYNDTYGHVVGDMVLRATVRAIRAHVKQRDLVGRWGGEEFGIGLRGANSAEAEGVAVRICATLAAAVIQNGDGKAISLPTASQGIAAIPESARTVDELINQADHALYRAKAMGRSQIMQAEILPNSPPESKPM